MKRKVRTIANVMLLGICLSLIFGINVFAANIKPTPLNDYESNIAGVTAYNMQIPVKQSILVQPIEIPSAGQLNIDISCTGISSSVDFELYSDANCTNKTGGYAYISSYDLTDNFQASVIKAGTYYLKMERGSYSSSVSSVANFTIKPYFYNGADKTLKAGVWSGTYGADYTKTIYHKIIINKPGYIILDGYAKGYGSTPKDSVNTTLTDDKKKALTGAYLYSTNDFKTYYGVKKGTYYIAVKDYGHYKLKYTAKAVTDKSASKKSKATLMKKNKKVNGLLVANDSAKKVDWYKIKLTKKQKIKFTATAKTNGYISLQIVPKNKRMIIVGSTTTFTTGTCSFKTRNKFPAGIYYIKVSKSLDASGYYTVKYK